MSFSKLKGLVLATVAALLVGGCVTTTNSPQRAVNIEKAEKTRVDAGLRYLRQGSKDDARRHFLKALELNEDSAGAHNGMALVYSREGEKDLAEKHFKQAIRSDDEYTLAKFYYGVFLYNEERYQEAHEQFTVASEDLNYGSRHNALLNLGRTQLQLGDSEAAMKSFKQALGIQFRMPQAHIEVASLYFDKKDFTSAKYYLDQFSKVSKATARSLWLGIRIERVFGNSNKEASYALALKNLHPYSQEYLEYKNSLKK